MHGLFAHGDRPIHWMKSIPVSIPMWALCQQVVRGGLGGFLLGLGSAIGNGCTSGHGISGNARLSARSAFYT